VSMGCQRRFCLCFEPKSVRLLILVLPRTFGLLIWLACLFMGFLQNWFK
jgi:hypothetical protein